MTTSLFMFLFSFLFSQESPLVDGVLAIVDNQIVLRSDIQEQVFFLAKEKNLSPQKTPLAFERLWDRVVQEQVDRLVVLSFAKKDTLVAVSSEEVNKTLNQRIDAYISVFGSKEALEDSMKMSINTIKGEYYNTIEEELLVEKFRFFNFNNTSITKQEVVSFFNENPDSFPKQEPVIDFSIIQVPVELSVETKDSVFLLAQNVKDSLVLGLLDFDLAAKRYSQDLGSASFGGSLGYTKRGSLLPEYEQVAFFLEVGSFSDPIETAFGFHLIKLEDRLGEKIHSKHILFSLTPGRGEVAKNKKLLEKEKERFFNDPSSFDSLAISYYNQYKNLSGYYVDFLTSSIPLLLQNRLSFMENHSFSEVFEEGGFVFLLYKYMGKKPTKLSLDVDWVLIEQTALIHKNYKNFQKWIKKKKKEVYIEFFY